MLLTSREAMSHYKISKPTLYKLINSGIIPAIKVGKQYRIIVGGREHEDDTTNS